MRARATRPGAARTGSGEGGAPTVCVGGALLASHANGVPTQADRLSTLFRDAGLGVIAVSSARNRYLRLAEIVATLLRRRHTIDLTVVLVYSGPSFVVATSAALLARSLRMPLVLSLHGGDLPAG